MAWEDSGGGEDAFDAGEYLCGFELRSVRRRRHASVSGHRVRRGWGAPLDVCHDARLLLACARYCYAIRGARYCRQE